MLTFTNEDELELNCFLRPPVNPERRRRLLEMAREREAEKIARPRQEPQREVKHMIAVAMIPEPEEITIPKKSPDERRRQRCGIWRSKEDFGEMEFRKKIGKLTKAIAHKHCIAVWEMRSKSRETYIVAARHAAWYWLRRTGHSLSQIAAFFDCDHTTVCTRSNTYAKRLGLPAVEPERWKK